MIQKLVVILFLSVLTFALLGTAQGVGDTILKPHAPIYINGNSDFTTENGVVSGSGTEGDPYIIEGWEITGGDFGISIGNSDTYFIIQNCKLYHMHDNGMYFKNVQNSLIHNCILQDIDEWNGILLESSYHNLVISNLIENSGLDGIALLRSDNNALLGNISRSNSRFEWGSGIKLYGSKNNLLEDNRVTGNRLGISLEYSSSDRSLPSIHNTVTSNFVADNVKRGINLWGALDNSFSRNIVSNTGKYGIVLWESNGNSFYDNVIANHINTHGIAIGDNQWNNGSEGNYWSDFSGWDANGDGISDSPHKIEGGGVDRYPLMRPWKSSVVAMGIKFTGPDEFVTIANWSQEDVDLTGWKLLAVNPEAGEVQHTLVFTDDCSLPKDGKLRVHSGPGSMTENNTGGAPSKTDLYGQWRGLEQGAYVWNDLGGMVRIVNPDGKVVDEYEYHWWMGQ